MQDQQQFEQLILQYNQLKNGAQEIRKLIENENYDSAMTKLKSREPIYLNCKCIRKFLELNEAQEKELNTLLDELKKIEQDNINFLLESMKQVKIELKRSQQMEKIQQAYDFESINSGSILNMTD